MAKRGRGASLGNRPMRYESIESQFWAEPDFEDWSPQARLLYLWALSNPLGHGVTGITKASAKQIALQTGVTPEAQDAAFAELGHRVKRYGEYWIWLCARFGHACESPNHWKAAVHFLGENGIPTQLAEDFWARYSNAPAFAKWKCDHPIKPLQAPTKPLQAPSKASVLSDSDPTPTLPDPKPSSPPKRTAPRKAKARTPGDPRVGEFEHWWGVAFQERFKIPYVCQFAADGKQLKAALAGLDAGVGDTMATLERAAKRFLADDSRRKYGGHTIRNFCSQLNSYTVDEPPKPARDDETVPIIHDIEAADAFKEQWAKDTAETKARVRAELEAKR